MYHEDLAYIHAAGFNSFALGAATEIVRRLRSGPIEVRHVVDAGCGSGPLSARLVEAGFRVTGIDISAEQIEMAKRAAPDAEFLVASIHDADLPRCEAVLVVGEALTYHDETLNAEARLARFLRRAAQALPAGGQLIFDLVVLGEPDLTGRSWRSGDDWAVLVETVDDRNCRTLTRSVETFRRVDTLYRRGFEVHRVHLFESTEVVTMIQDAGFTVETAEAYGDAPAFTRRMVFFATRQSAAG